MVELGKVSLAGGRCEHGCDTWQGCVAGGGTQAHVGPLALGRMPGWTLRTGKT